MRKLISALLCVLLLLVCVPALAEEQQTREAFAWGDWVYHLNEDGTACLECYTGPMDTRSLDIPTEVDGYPVTVIGDSCMPYLREVRELVIPEGIVELGDYALASLDQLQKVSLPSTLRIIGPTCFLNDFFLEEMNIPDSVTAIGEGAFGCCSLSKLTVSPDHPAVEMVDGVMVDREARTLLWFPRDRQGAYTVPADIPRIGDFAFSDAKLTSLTVPDSVTSLGDNAITSQTLEVIEIGAGVTEVTDAIGTISALREYRVSPDNPALEVIDGVLFQKEPKTLVSYPPDRAGEKYVIPEGTKILSSNAFTSCRLKTIECPSSLREIRQSAFSYCDKLTGVLLNEGLESMGNSIYYCQALTEIALPNSLWDVKENPIDYCDKLKTIRIDKDHPYLCIMNNALVRKDGMLLVSCPALNVKKYTVPEGVKGLAFGAFGNGATLEEVIVPEGVESIEAVAFINCPKLRSVTLPRSVTFLSQQAFLGLSKLTLNVLAERMAKYDAAPQEAEA